MTTITCGMNKMEVFWRLLPDDFQARQGATIKATMCPEINSYENYGPVPKTDSSIAGAGQGKVRNPKVGPWGRPTDPPSLAGWYVLSQTPLGSSATLRRGGLAPYGARIKRELMQQSFFAAVTADSANSRARNAPCQ